MIGSDSDGVVVIYVDINVIRPELGTKRDLAGESRQPSPQLRDVEPRDLLQGLGIGLSPNLIGRFQQARASLGQGHPARSSVDIVAVNLDQATTLQWLQICRDGGPVHGKRLRQ